MMQSKFLPYQRPYLSIDRLDWEGLICLSETVTVDELYNRNIPASGETTPSETMYFEF